MAVNTKIRIYPKSIHKKQKVNLNWKRKITYLLIMKTNFEKAIANNKANSETISRNRGNNQNIKLKPIITFGQNQ